MKTIEDSVTLAFFVDKEGDLQIAIRKDKELFSRKFDFYSNQKNENDFSEFQNRFLENNPLFAVKEIDVIYLLFPEENLANSFNGFHKFLKKWTQEHKVRFWMVGEDAVNRVLTGQEYPTEKQLQTAIEAQGCMPFLSGTLFTEEIRAFALLAYAIHSQKYQLRAIPAPQPLKEAYEQRNGYVGVNSKGLSEQQDAFLSGIPKLLGEKEKEYGDSQVSFEYLAKRWSQVLGVQVTRPQVALCLIDLKMSRLCKNPRCKDSLTDVVGYATLLNRFQ